MKKLYHCILLFTLIHSGLVLNAKNNSSHPVLESIVDKTVASRILVLPSATISGTTAVCQNTTSPQITFTGSGGTAPYTFVYKIGTGANVSIISNGTGTATVNAPTATAGSFVYTLVSVQDSSGTQTQTGSATVTVNALPTITGNLNACIGSSSNLNGSGTANSWVSSNNAVATVDNTGLVSGIAVGTTNITYKTSNNCEKTILFTVNPLPVVDFLTNATATTCSGSPIQFTSNITAGTAPYTYAWDFGDGTTSTLANPIHSLTSLGCGTGSVTVKLTVTDANGCTSTQVSHSVSVLQKPDIAFSDVNNPLALEPFSNCVNASATNSAYTIIVGNALPPPIGCITQYNINWGDGTSLSNVTFPISHTYTLLGVYNMVVTALGTNGCSNSKTYPVKNISNPGLGIQTPSNTQDLCAPTLPLAFEITGWGNNFIDTVYNINYGDGLGILTITQAQMVSSIYYNAANPSLSLDYPIPYSYTTSSCPSGGFTLTVSAVNACKTTTLNYAGITIFKKPVVDFVSPTSVCVNTSVLFTNTTNAINGQNCTQNSIYTWNFGDGSPIITTPPQSPQNINHTYTTFGTFTVTLTSQNFCGIDTKTQQICIEPPITPQFTLNNNLGCSPMVVTTNNTTVTTNSCNQPTYVWSVVYIPSVCGTSATIPTQSTTNATFNFTEAGTYTITLTATNSCGSFSSSQTVTVKKPPTVTINSIASLCQTLPTTTISPTAVIANCGTQALTYAWNFPGGVPTTSNLAIPGPISYATAGTYTVSLTVTNECGSTLATDQTFTINQAPVLTNTPLTQTICSGSTTALVTLTSNPAGASFSWAATATAGISGFTPSGASTIPVQTISTTNASSGTVTYAITPSIGGCPGPVVNYVITVNPAPTITQPASSTVCIGGTPTTLSVTVSNATGVPTYQWYSNSINNTTSGTLIPSETNATYIPPATTVGTLYYYCIITLPSGGCSSITSNTAAVVITPLATINPQPTPTQSICVGATVSPLTVGYTGGTGTASYQWFSNTTNTNSGGTPISGATTASYTPPVFNTAGSFYYYAVVTLSGNGCGPITSNPAEIIVVSDPIISAQPITSQTLCQGSSPAILTVTATGGIGTFSYQWFSNTINSNIGGTLISGETTSTFTPPTATVGTTYYYSVISQTSVGCSVTSATAEVIVISAPTITNQPLSSSVCQNGIPTTLSVTLSNATGVPTYQWYSNSINNTTSGTPIPLATNATYIPPATTVGTLYYYCVITLPSGGCSSITSTTATVIITPAATISTQPTATQSLCIGGTIATPLTINYTGGTGTATYQWFSNSTNTNSGGTLISGATTASYTLPVFNIAGSFYYYAVVTLSGNGCGPITSNAAEIIVVSDPIISIQPIASQTLCQGSSPTNLTVTATGGIGTFSYQWFSNTLNSNVGGTLISGETNSTFTPSTASVGTTYYYSEIFQTGLGCSVTSATAAVIVNLAPTFISQPQSSTICLGNTPTLLSVTYSNGVGTPQYQWYSNTANTTVGGNPISGATNSSYNPPATAVGTIYYYCIVTLPSGGCSNLTSTIAAVVVNQNPVIANKTALICSGNIFTITPNTLSGDIVPMGTTYTWTSPAINPANSITGASAQTTPQTNISQNLINITSSPATVTYTVTPISGVCAGVSFTAIVTVNPSISPNTITTNSSCFGSHNGAIQTNITGGVPFGSGSPYLISWTGPNGFTSAAPSISNLAPGNYSLSISDAGGCPINETYLITEPDDILIATDLEKDVTCFNDANGVINISISGGTIPYHYTWTKNGIPFATTEDLSNLSPGVYEVTVYDANTCGPKTATFTITEPPILAINLINKTDILCFGDATGAININVAGGSPAISGYDFAWSGPNGFLSTSQNLTAIIAGTYNLVVTDNSGCAKNLSVTLTQTPEILITPTTTPIICYGDNNGSISIVVSGGVAPYQISWSNLGSGTFQDNLSAGNYLITVTDGNNCVKSLNVNIPEPPIFTINPVVKNISCFGAKNGSINLNLVGGIAPVKLVWSDSAVAGTVRNNLGPGSYTATITDGKPCTITKTFIILEPQLLVLSANITDAFDCDNANTGAINLLVSGGSAPFIYTWSNGATTEDLANIPAGNYLVTVTDANGCTKQAQYSINRPAPIVTGVVTKTDFDCETKYVKQTFEADVTGGVPPYQLVWSSGTVSGVNNEIMNTNQNGTVILNVTDAIGCKSNYSFNVDIPQLGTPSFNVGSYSYSTFGIYSINDPIQFTNTATGDYISVAWDFGDGTFSTELNPVHTFINPKDYVVTQTVTYPLGCVYVQKITLIVGKGYVLVVPNAFTPNNDSVNDTFRPVTKGLKNVLLDVYDTWGSLIYSETGDVLRGWDGKIKGLNAENGNYFCKVSGETFYGIIVNVDHPFVLIK